MFHWIDHVLFIHLVDELFLLFVGFCELCVVECWCVSLSGFVDLLCGIAVAGCREILCWIIEELKAVAIVTVLTHRLVPSAESPARELALCHAVLAYSGDQRNHTVLERVRKWLGRLQSCQGQTQAPRP